MIKYRTMDVFEKNPNLGFYEFGGQKYFNKLNALLAAGANGWPTWHFNDHVYDRLDWSMDPAIDIEELYRLRAKQLREKYDYLVLFFSGGADSSTVMRSFVDNNLHLDEVVIGHPESGMSNWVNVRDADPRFTASEYELCAKPQLENLRITSPNTKITVNDYFNDMITTYRSDEWIMSARDYMHPSFVSRYSKKNLAHIKAICESGKSVAFIYGIDKPRLAIIDGKYHCYFLDIIANTATWDIDDYPNAKTEYFYWTPDLPEIAVKQAHCVSNWLNHPKNSKFQRLLKWPPEDFKEQAQLKSIFERAVREPLYPKWDFDLFQTYKSLAGFTAEQDYWFFKQHQNTHIYDTWKAGVDHLIRLIDSKWLQKDAQGQIQGLKGFISKMRYITDVKIQQGT